MTTTINYKLAILMLIQITVQSKDYVVAYIFEDSLDEKMPDNQMKVYQTVRFNSQVLMNSKTRSQHANLNILKNQTNLNSNSILTSGLAGNLTFQRSPIPQHMWIQKKQVIIIEVDINSFPKQAQKLSDYSNLFRHKGESIYIFNSDQINPVLQQQIVVVFGLMEDNQQICEINMYKNTLEQNKNKIEQCYKNSVKRMVMGKYKVTWMNMISEYGLFALSYLIICVLIAFVSPFLMVFWHNKQKSKYSPV